jgi:hypothetical protein
MKKRTSLAHTTTSNSNETVSFRFADELDTATLTLEHLRKCLKVQLHNIRKDWDGRVVLRHNHTGEIFVHNLLTNKDEVYLQTDPDGISETMFEVHLLRDGGFITESCNDAICECDKFGRYVHYANKEKSTQYCRQCLELKNGIVLLFFDNMTCEYNRKTKTLSTLTDLNFQNCYGVQLSDGSIVTQTADTVLVRDTSYNIVKTISTKEIEHLLGKMIAISPYVVLCEGEKHLYELNIRTEQVTVLCETNDSRRVILLSDGKVLRTDFSKLEIFNRGQVVFEKEINLYGNVIQELVPGKVGYKEGYKTIGILDVASGKTDNYDVPAAKSFLSFMYSL